MLLLFKRKGLPSEFDGNMLLDVLMGAELHLHEAEADRKTMELASVKDLVDKIVERHVQAGRRPYIAPLGASLTEGSMRKPLGGIAYVNAALELLEQAEALGTRIDTIVVATGSGSMQAGLLVGTKLLAPHIKVVGISASADTKTMISYVDTIARQTLAELAPDSGISINSNDIIVLDQFGEAYGVLLPDTVAAIRRVGEEEGILLDPVYTGRAMAGLLNLAGSGGFCQDNVVFLHSGGTPALFAYRDGITSYLSTAQEAGL